MEIYAVDALSTEAMALSDLLLPYIPADRIARLNRYRSRNDYQRSLLGEALARALISQKLGLQNAEIDFCRNEYGKPALKGSDAFHFNLSHSGKWVVCAVDGDPVGIDVEEIKKIDLSIAKRYFSKDEYDDLAQWDEEERISRFFDLWTLKESYIKAVGKGLSLPLDAFSIKAMAGDAFYVDNDSRFLLKKYHIEAGYKLAACSAGKAFPASITHMGLQSLLALK